VTASSGQPPIRVLIADDQRVVREGLTMLVDLIDGVEVAGSASDGEEAVRLAVAHRPDVIPMDLRMPGVDGITATAQLGDRLPSARVLGADHLRRRRHDPPGIARRRPWLPDHRCPARHPLAFGERSAADSARRRGTRLDWRDYARAPACSRSVGRHTRKAADHYPSSAACVRMA